MLPSPDTEEADWPGFYKSALSVVPLVESGQDLAFWLDRSYGERMRAIELQRQICYGWRSRKDTE